MMFDRLLPYLTRKNIYRFFYFSLAFVCLQVSFIPGAINSKKQEKTNKFTAIQLKTPAIKENNKIESLETKHINTAAVNKKWENPERENMQQARRNSSLSSRGFSRSDLNLLAHLIYAEARGEPFTGQVAVGAVIINRMHNPQFPATIKEIIYKKGEFCTVRDGQIYLTPDAQAYRAASLAIQGWDPTNGALYFYNPARTTSRWIWTRTVTTKIGNHVFAR